KRAGRGSRSKSSQNVGSGVTREHQVVAASNGGRVVGASFEAASEGASEGALVGAPESAGVPGPGADELTPPVDRSSTVVSRLQAVNDTPARESRSAQSHGAERSRFRPSTSR